MTQIDCLKKAIKHLGGVSRVAKMCLLTQPSVSSWLKKGRIPIRHVLTIERATGGQVTRYEMRPDVYGNSE